MGHSFLDLGYKNVQPLQNGRLLGMLDMIISCHLLHTKQTQFVMKKACIEDYSKIFYVWSPLETT